MASESSSTSLGRSSLEQDAETQPGETCSKSQEEKNLNFLRAIIKNDEKKAIASIEAGVDIEFAFRGKAALFYAVSGGQSKIVEALVKAGANVNITDDDGKTPLFYCAEKLRGKRLLLHNRLPMVRGFDYDNVASTLIRAGADVNVTDVAGKTVLMYALQNKNVGLVCRLIDSGADVEALDEKRRTALFYPSVYESASMLQKLLKGVDINFPDMLGKTALMVAAEQDQESAVAELIKAGADVNLTDKKGKTALMYCTQIQIPVYEYMSMAEYVNVDERKKHILSMLINAGADLNKRDHLGKTSLIYCVHKEILNASYVSVSMLDLIDFNALATALIKSGADVNIVDNEGKSALIYALQDMDMNERLALTLLKAGADASLLDEEGKTPLIHYAEVKSIFRYSISSSIRSLASYHPGSKISNHNPVASMLIKACPDINKTDNEGKTALMYSLINSNENLACALIEAGADVNISDEEGKTALFYSLQDNNERLVCALIEAGADVNVSDKEGKTALLYSLQDSNEHLACVLIEAGANVNITDKEGKTALIYCAQNQRERTHQLQKYTSSSNSSERDTACSRVGSLLIKSCANINKTDNEGKTALIHSLQEDNERLACSLIEAGADVNLVDDDGKTALFYAAIYSNLEHLVFFPELMHHLDYKQKWDEATTQEHVIPKLLDAGAEVNLIDKQGKTALMHYAENEYINIIVQYLGMGSKFESLFAHFENEYNHVAGALIKASEDVNIADDQGKTALTYFIQNGKYTSAIEIIDASADVNITDADGKTVLSYIPPDCDKIVVNKIIESSTNINKTDNEGKTALIHSLQENNERLACALIEAGADVKVVDKTGRNALFYATVKGYENVFSKLSNSIDINVTDNQGKTVLMHAVQHVKKSFVEELIHSGAEVNAADKEGKTALIYCAQTLMKLNEGGVRHIASRKSGYEQAVTTKVVTVASMLIKAGADVNISDNEGKTALIYSLQDDDLGKLSSLLMEAGADLSIMDKNGKSALLYAVLYDRELLIQDLIDAGADTNVCDNEGKTALIYCAQKQVRSKEEQMIQRYSLPRYFIYDAYDEYPGSDSTDDNIVASMLIKSRTDVNIADNKGRTALIYSLLHGNKDLACTLIEAGADVNVVDQDGHTALVYALISEEERVFQRLMKSQASSYSCTSDSEEESTPSLHVSAQDRESLVIKLISAGANVNLTYDEGETALIHSAKNGNMNLVSALIEAGADVNAADNEGKTALIHCTCYKGQHKLLLFMTGSTYDSNTFKNIAFALINAGAEVNIADKKGKTALIYCIIHNNNEEVVSQLIEAGADTNITDHEGVSAIFYGVGNDKIVHLLINKGKANINKRDHCGRAPIYYAMKESLTSARHLLGMNSSGLKRKDCYGITILSFFVEHCLRGKRDMSEGLNLLQEKGIQLEATYQALVDSLFCRILLITLTLQGKMQNGSLSQKPDVKGIVQVLNLAKKYVDDGQKCEIIQNLVIMMEEATDLCIAMPSIIDSLVELGANPSYADIDGNTALHYAACLPLAGASQDAVMKICHQLDDLGASVHTRNHQKETPLLFCLSKKGWINKDNEIVKVKALVQVCSFLLEQGSSLEEATANGKSVFHLVMELFKLGFLLEDDIVRKDVLNEALELLNLFPSSQVMKGVTVNKRDGSLNSPLHVWAMLDFRFPTRNKDSSTDDPYAFEKHILASIFKHHVDCGAKLNDRNEMDQTPLHLCKTWTAAKLLIDAGAKTNVLDSKGSPPLLVTIKRNQDVINESDASCIYPDVLQQPKEFWKTVLKNKLDPWTVNNNGASVMSILVKSEAFILAKALLDVACEENYIQTDAHAVSLLNAICKDRSTRAQWKSILVEQILKSRKSAITPRDGEDTPLHHCWRNIIKQMDELPLMWPLHYIEDIFVSEITTSVHWTIVKQLLSHRFNCNVRDGSGQSCMDIAHKHPVLEDLLKNQMNIEVDPVVIRWTSASKTHKSTLAKVARKQECRQVKSLWYHQNNIQEGSFGLVFVGINQEDGREVAIKRMEKLRMHRPEDKREITSLTRLADCEQVVRYLFFFEDEDFSYVVLELMEGNLNDYLGGTDFDAKKGITLCADVVQGLKYLHELGIIHRDLKPTNILFKTFPKLCLKIADFGLSRCIDKCNASATVYGSVAGTRCWIAPEVLKSPKKEHSMASDVFSCGLLLHYILIVKRHPFSPVASNKSELQIHIEIEANLLGDSKEGLDSDSLFPEATDLIISMLDNARTNRPTAAEALAHPMFWPKKKKMGFLIAVGNQPEVGCPRDKRATESLTPVENDLENSFTTIVTGKTWDDSGYVNMPTIYAEMSRKRKYNTSSVIELVRLIRNTHAHVSDDKRPTSIRKLVLEDFVFLESFPNLVLEVFKCTKKHGWNSREEIKYALDDKMTSKPRGGAEGITGEMPTSMEID